jgi:hypothetical protein
MHNIATEAPKAPPISIAPNLTQLTINFPKKSVQTHSENAELDFVWVVAVARPRNAVINRLVETKSNPPHEKRPAERIGITEWQSLEKALD